ncbi:PstS family phosphate ABC transporter substrate-binding protein [Vibrio mexicanus]|uniref:PstS family phosphate ABC transporter substrate-binding protein n=1 Tax=Vibrio mexicanus TaxID=1004326 RepID=UPI00063C9E8B|nr:PstS family phosphate ABC transporter substrate-binding protein [Vibrio mexicanus]
MHKLILPITYFLLSLAPVAAWAKDLIKVEGSSTVYPITYQIAQQFMLAEGSQTQVVVGITGTGGGFRKFCRGRTDLSNASRPIKKAEKELCLANGIEFLELPIALDAITVVVNKNNEWLDSLSLDELNKIWRFESEGKLNTWNKVSETFQTTPLTLHGPGPDSGTYDYFVNVVLNKEDSRRDYAANEDDTAMAAEVAADETALAFLGYAYYVKNKNQLKALAISNEDNEPVLPSADNVTSGQYSALSRPLFIYVNKSALNKRASVKRFVNHYLQPHNIRLSVIRSGYIPLSPDMYTVARSILLQGKSGSVFDSDDLSANFERFLYQQQ